MSYFASMEISATGMAFERLRLDAVALNLANANSSAASPDSVFQPKRAVASRTSPSLNVGSFGVFMNGLETQSLVGNPRLVSMSAEPKLVHDPSHPHANQDGYVAYPGVNPLSEMVVMMEAVRAYEANVKAINGAKSMAMKALEIGGSR